MTKIKDITKHLEETAPSPYQESYDNSGLLVGDPEAEVQQVLITLDTTEEVIKEAINLGCTLIISHHPIIFKGLKKLTGTTYAERVVIEAIKNNIALYALHTNFDNVQAGVNKAIARRLELNNTKILSPKTGILSKLTTFIPPEFTKPVLDALHKAGAGMIGNYDHCSFQVSGTGTFRPNESAKPYTGSQNEFEEVTENRIEIIFPSHLKNQVLNALHKTHPYEEIAYYLHDLANTYQDTGSGMIGTLAHEMESLQFIHYLKEKMNCNIIRHTAFVKDKIKTVAFCGGAGSFLLNKAKSAGADIFISADFKYHEFFNAENEIIIADIGHYESEVFTKELIFEILNEKFPKFALHLSKVDTNPIFYI